MHVLDLGPQPVSASVPDHQEVQLQSIQSSPPQEEEEEFDPAREDALAVLQVFRDESVSSIHSSFLGIQFTRGQRSSQYSSAPMWRSRTAHINLWLSYSMCIPLKISKSRRTDCRQSSISTMCTLLAITSNPWCWPR